MKTTTTRLLLALFAVFALNACGDVEDELNGDTDNGAINSVNILDLELGYVINGYNLADEDVYLTYCRNTYTYYRLGDTFSGTFSIKTIDNRINMTQTHKNDKSSSTSYRIDTGNGELELYQNYDLYDIKYDITVTSIIQSEC